MKENTIEKKKKLTQKQKINLCFIWSMLAIPILYWLIFYLYKNFDSIILAFRKLDGTWTTDMVKAAITALTMADLGLSIALRNTFIYFVKDLLMIPFQLMIFDYFNLTIKPKKISCKK